VSCLFDIRVALLLSERPAAVVIVSSQEAVDFDDVNPQQQVRVIGRIRPAVGCDADDTFVDGVDDVDRALRHLLGAEGRLGEKSTGALQAAPGVAAES